MTPTKVTDEQMTQTVVAHGLKKDLKEFVVEAQQISKINENLGNLVHFLNLSDDEDEDDADNDGRTGGGIARN